MAKVEHKPTQNERIIEYIKEHGGITQLEASEFLGVQRLPSRVFDLKTLGFPIASKYVKGKNRFGEPCHYKMYFLKEGANR